MQESESEYRSFLQESLANLLIVKAFTGEDRAVERLTKLREERFYWVYRKTGLGTASSTVMSLAFQGGYLIAFSYGAWQLSRQQITYGTMSVFLTLVNRVQAPILGLAPADSPDHCPVDFRREDHGVTENSRGAKGSRRDPWMGDRSGASKCMLRIYQGTGAETGESEDLSGRICRHCRRVRYRQDNTDPHSDGLSGNGSGNGGFLQWQRTEAGDWSFRPEVYCLCPQGNTLFSGTVRENLQMGREDASEEELWAAPETGFRRKFCPVTAGGAGYRHRGKRAWPVGRTGAADRHCQSLFAESTVSDHG